MCGRYANFMTEQALIDAFSIATQAGDDRLLPARFNIGPMQYAPIIRADAKSPGATPDRPFRALETARWGLVPGWAKDPRIGAKMFNARVETVDQKPSFRSAFAKRRCLVPANGYYEWQVTDSGKVPKFIRPESAEYLAFAGLYEWWREPAQADSPWLLTFSVITTAARGPMQEIHDRQPVMLGEEWWDTWLNPDTSAAALLEAAAAPAPQLAWHSVGPDVGNIRNEGPELISPVS